VRQCVRSFGATVRRVRTKQNLIGIIGVVLCVWSGVCLLHFVGCYAWHVRANVRVYVVLVSYFQAGPGYNGGRVGGRAPSMPGTRVYVGNLSWEAQWQDLKDHMRGPNQDLNVLHADIMSESTGLCSLLFTIACLLPPPLVFAVVLVLGIVSA
jgi:hypothetical protein